LENPSSKILLVAFSCSVAAFMYSYVEKPFRLKTNIVTGKNFTLLLTRYLAITVPIVLLAVSMLAERGGSWDWRLSPDQRALTYLQKFGFAPCLEHETTCEFGTSDGPLGVRIIGDSFAQQLVAAFRPVLRQHGQKGTIHSRVSCILLVGIRRVAHNGKPINECKKPWDEFLLALARSDEPIVIAQDWLGYGALSMRDDSGLLLDTTTSVRRLEIYRAAIEKTLALIGNKRRVILVGAQVTFECSIDRAKVQPGPLSHAAPRPCPAFSPDDFHARSEELNLMLQQLQQLHSNNVSLLFTGEYMCAPDCPVVMDGAWLYRDNHHLTVAGAEYLSRRARRYLEDLLKLPVDRSMR
jgi:hypothetical protein